MAGNSKWWVSCQKFTGQVNVDDDETVLTTPPVWKVFRGQKFCKLISWLAKFGPVTQVKL